MELKTFFEVLMMVGFGASWPFSIMRLLLTRKSEGKSLLFLGIIMGGYVAGVGYKIVGDCDWVIALYIFNFFQVAFDFFLTIKYRQKKAT